eukprot:TRINITY_DN26316_c0_g1_i4.p1 TRINITY_DN26316_c0_g1~~TRINITY_DN26316_c0_g1_i4.p1  ORF type:complete len:313 (-),score=58.87 TRINITY_DN26316_c0_g1_i4:581-1519(-)
MSGRTPWLPWHALIAWLADLPRACSAALNGSDVLAAERKVRFIAQHALFGRLIERAELPGLQRTWLEARKLAAAPHLTVAFLIQGEEDVSEKEAAMWSQTCAEVYVLTFKTMRADALFFPKSLLAEGRNVLLAAAAAHELKRGYTYTYYVMMDGDADASPPWKVVVPDFLDFLRDWQPAVGLPAPGDFPEQPSGTTPLSVFLFDHIFLAVHVQAAERLLPYDTSYDKDCSWVSQWHLTLQSNSLYKGHTLVLPSFRIRNPGHADYPRFNCYHHMAAASARLRARAPPGGGADKTCFPDPPFGNVLFRSKKLG